MRAMILAAGDGTRLRPITLETPKILVPLFGRPVVLYIMSWLKSHNISKIALNLHHLSDKVCDYLGDGSSFNMAISYSWEETLLGTAGAIKKMSSFFDGTFIVVSGDTVTNFNLTEMIRLHKERNSKATIALIETSIPEGGGLVKIDDKGKVLSFLEKPKFEEIGGRSSAPVLINAGTYILEQQVLDYIPEGRFCDFGRDVFPKLLELGIPMFTYKLNQDDIFIDVGTIKKYKQANSGSPYPIVSKFNL